MFQQKLSTNAEWTLLSSLDLDHHSEVASTMRKAAFFHLDLGVGGAEQLVLQAALQTQQFLRDPDCANPRVDVFTSFFDRKRCLDAAKDRAYPCSFDVQGKFLKAVGRI